MDSTALVAVIGTAVGGIFVTLVNVWLSERVKKANQDSIERLKNDLSRASFEYQTRFARLHERRIDVIAEVYRNLVATEMAFNMAMFPFQYGASDEEIDRKAAEYNQSAVDAMNRFVECCFVGEVWLDETLVNALERLLKALRDAWRQFNHPKSEEGQASQKTDAWTQVSSTEVPALKAEIRDAMRTMLGMVPDSSSPVTPKVTRVPWWQRWRTRRSK